MTTEEYAHCTPPQQDDINRQKKACRMLRASASMNVYDIEILKYCITFIDLVVG